MRSLRLLALVILALPERSSAQAAPAPTPEMLAMEAKLLTRIGPETQAWIKQEAARELTSNTVSEATAVNAVGSGALGSLAGQDIEALAFLVLMQAAKSAQEDLKSIMAGVKSINNAKARYRQGTISSTARASRVPDSLERHLKVESVRLQTANDRQAKMLAALSTMVQKIPVGPAPLTQVMK